MNAARREHLTKVAEKLRQCVSELETLRDEEQDYYDNMPENFQAGEKGSAAEDAVNAIESAKDSAEQAADELDGITQQ